ncbi:MAG: hypothetical protein ACOVSW_10945 [Candidatus Kapaibacteriota bacterium]|jgi:hypothetical protein
MPHYVLHKKGFYYNDEYYSSFLDDLVKADDDTPITGIRGSIVATYSSLEAAREAKVQADIDVIVVYEDNLLDFLEEDSNFVATAKRLAEYLLAEFPDEENLIEFGYHFKDEYSVNNLDAALEQYRPFSVYLPDEMTAEQMKHVLEIMNLSFHDIVEYPDGEEPAEEDFILDEDLTQFPIA